MISVVIVTYNSEACVGACIDALAASLPDAEILVIDNASTDGSRAVAARPWNDSGRAPPRTLDSAEPATSASGRATREHILFLNPDVTIRAVDAAEAREAARRRIVRSGGAGSYGKVHICRASRCSGGALADVGERCWPRAAPRSPAHGAGEAVWASGAALLVRASEFLGMGGFDPRYFMYFEDRDLSWRYRGAGLAVRTSPVIRRRAFTWRIQRDRRSTPGVARVLADGLVLQ